MSNFQQNEIPKSTFDNAALKLWAKNSEDTWATMNFRAVATGRKYNDNVLEITVWTNVSNDSDKSISAKLDVISAGIMMSNLQDCIETKVEPGEEYVAPIIEIHETKWAKENGRNKPDGTYVAAKLHMGKDKEGRVWMALVSTKSGRPNIKFIFHANKTRTLVTRDGNAISPAVASILAADSFLHFFRQSFYVYMYNNYRHPESSQGGNQGNRGNQGGNQGNGGGNVSDDDIPF